MEERLNEKIEKLLEKADKKLNVSISLFKTEDYEDCISRAYYAMYHAALALLLSKSIEVKTHAGLLTMLSLHFVKTDILEKKYYDIISNAKDLRENGDYEPFFIAKKEDAESILDDAKKFIKKIKEIIE